MRFILKFLLFLIIIITLAFGGISIYLYSAQDINIFNAIGQVIHLNDEVKVDEIVTNPINTDNTLTEAKINLVKSGQNLPAYFAFEDKEVGYFVNRIFENSENILATVEEITFLPVDDNNQFIDLKVVLKIELLGRGPNQEELKDTFPYNILTSFFPKDVYLTLITDYNNKGTGSLTINNNLDDEEIFKILAKADEDLARENLYKKYTEKVYNWVYGSGGTGGFIYNVLRAGATDYVFKTYDNQTKLYLFNVDTSHNYEINYNYPDNIENQNKIENKNPSSYVVTDNDIELLEPKADGYNFIGWFDSNNKEVKTIDCFEAEDINLTAKFEVIEYTITLNLNGGISNQPGPIKYTIEDPTFTIDNPIKNKDGEAVPFKGWVGEEYAYPEDLLIIYHGTTGNLIYSAVYEGEAVFLTLHITDDISLTKELEAGTMVTSKLINDLIESKLSGFSVNKLFKANNDEFSIGTVLNEDMDLYCKEYNYVIDSLYFGPYYNEFYGNTETIEIDTTKKLDAYVSYVIFYDLTEYETATLNITYSDTYTIKNAIDNITSKEHYSTNSTLVSTTNRVYVLEKTQDSYAVNTVTNNKENAYPKIDYLFANNTHEADDHYLNILNRPQTIVVHNSYQLYYAIMNGFCVFTPPGTSAADILEKAANIVWQICDKNMSNEEKMHAIYEWLATNVHYDHLAANTLGSASPKVARTYDSWAIEGALNNNMAVCEGYAKTVVLLAGLEGIPAICVSGNNHEWNKVYLNGVWYNLDATFASTGTTYDNKNVEIFTNKYFLTTDQAKKDSGYETNEFVACQANIEYPFYKTFKIADFDYNITSQTEILQAINYIKENTEKDKTYCFEFTFTSPISANEFVEEFCDLLAMNGSVSYSKENYNDAILATFIFKRK